MSALATMKKGKAKGGTTPAKQGNARTKKLVGGCVGAILLVYVGSSLMADNAKGTPPKVNKAAAAKAAQGKGAAGATTGAAPGAAAAGGATDGAVVVVPTTTPWAPSPRNPFVAGQAATGDAAAPAGAAGAATPTPATTGASTATP